jgi:outer membrane protein assembly factor BamB
MLDYSGLGAFAPFAGGYVNAIRMDSEQSQPANTCAWNYLLHSGKAIQLPSQDTITYNGGDLWQPAVLQTPMDSATSGLPSNVPIREPRPYGAPVTADGKVFVTVTGKIGVQSVSAILCFRENADFVIRITENGGYTADGMSRGTAKRLYNPTTQVPYKVKVWQPDLISDVTSTVDPLQQAVEIFPADGMIDYERGTITVKDFNKVKIKMRPPNNIGYPMTPSLPVWVFLDDKEVPIDFGTWVPRLPALDDAGLNSNIKNLLRPRGDSVDLSRWNNLLWYFVVPNNREICSTPMVLGGKVYFLTSDGLLASINAENGLTQAERLEPTDTSNVQPMLQIPNFGALPLSARVNNYLAASNGVILAPGPTGLFAASNLPTLIADGSRVVEIDGAGETKWSMDKITMPVSIPQTANDTAPRTSIPVNRPARAKYTPKGEILLVNTGSNQVCVIDKTGNIGIQSVNGGYIRWMYDKFSDPYQILKTGQSNTISSPVDAEFWTEIEGSEFVYHCMIADAGNHRVVDLVYRLDSASNQVLNTGIDPDTGFVLPELRWATRSEKRYTIESLQRVFRDTLSDVQDVWIACSAVQTMGAGGSADVAKGAVMSVPYRATTVTGAWNYVVTDSGLIDANPPVADGLIGLRYVRTYGPPNSRYMFICDKFGVSKLNISSAGALTLAGQLKEADYQARSAAFAEIPLTATSVQEVSLGNWMIVNSFVGGSFGGEVFEYTPPAPNVTPLPSAFRPLCPTTAKNSYALNQPSSASRAF